MNKSEARTAQELRNGYWVEIDPMKIKMGMIFRMFEPDGTPVKDKLGKTYFLAISHAYYSKDGIGSIMIDGGYENGR